MANAISRGLSWLKPTNREGFATVSGNMAKAIFEALRVTDWENRLAGQVRKIEKSKILKLCLNNTFRELLSKILFRFF